MWARDWALPDAPPSDYAFLVDRLVDRATLDRAEALAKKWGVLPHAVMIANGWLSESDYYRALARESGVPFQDDIAAHKVTAPASLKSPRECLARGLLKRRARHGAYVYAPERLRPSKVEHVLAQIEPYRISLATPQTVRDAVRGHFAKASPPRRSTPRRSRRRARSIFPAMWKFWWVPDLHPRTKPKALNYALPLARGDHLVIYDAEDRPERDQLRKARSVSPRPSEPCLPPGEAQSLQRWRGWRLAYARQAPSPAQRTTRRPMPSTRRRSPSGDATTSRVPSRTAPASSGRSA
ncbi:MAG TPA: hypothetical protein VK986_10855 [Tepidisphaeraceae bacterium]|nr:hypothetical protein [Tepidisphaeraceae bacterium]